MKNTPRTEYISQGRVPVAMANGIHKQETEPEQWTDKAKDIGMSIVETVESTIRTRPLTCVGIAAGLGVLAAFWSKRK